MDSQPKVDQLGVTEKKTCDSIDKSDKDSTFVESINPIHLSSPPLATDNAAASLGPVTPYPNKECIDLTSNFTSPFEDDCPSTPREDVFDPFAPGPEKLMLAPHCVKNLEKTRNDVARRLNFSLGRAKECVSETEFEDDKLFESVFDNLLEAIVSKQTEDIIAEMLAFDSRHDVIMTPPGAPRLAGIAETCPGAPLKPVKKSRNIDMSLCRRLDFDF